MAINHLTRAARAEPAKAKAQQHLAALERLCGKGCAEHRDLAEAIAQAK